MEVILGFFAWLTEGGAPAIAALVLGAPYVIIGAGGVWFARYQTRVEKNRKDDREFYREAVKAAYEHNSIAVNRICAKIDMSTKAQLTIYFATAEHLATDVAKLRAEEFIQNGGTRRA